MSFLAYIKSHTSPFKQHSDNFTVHSWKWPHTHNHLMTLFRDYPSGPVPEEIFTHSHPSWSSDILYQLPPPTIIYASSLFNLCAWQSFSTISLQVLFSLPPLGLAYVKENWQHLTTNIFLLITALSAPATYFKMMTYIFDLNSHIYNMYT